MAGAVEAGYAKDSGVKEDQLVVLPDGPSLLAAVQAGARFLTTQTDIAFLATAAAAWTRGLREALGR